MANPRLPAAKAKVTGADVAHPGRHAKRKDPKTSPLGKATKFLDEHGKEAWEGFKRELPWLMESDRSMVEVCAKVRGELLSGEDVGVTRLSMYQSMLSKLGASPSDRTKVSAGDDEEEGNEFFDN